MRSMILCLLLTACALQLAAQVPMRMYRTDYEFRIDERGSGRWWWNKAERVSDSSMLVRQDGFLVTAVSGPAMGDTLHLIGIWPGLELSVNGVSTGLYPDVAEPVPPAHVGRFTGQEWNALDDSVRTEFRNGVLNWPVENGAPFVDVDWNGRYDPQPDALPAYPGDVPLVIGDEAMWTVTTDTDTPDRRRKFLFHTGLNLRQMTWAHAGEGCPERVIFQRLRIVNTTLRYFREVYFSMFADIALGDPSDDLVGIDTTLGLAYFYNASDSDACIADPPAAGYLLLQGPAVRDVSSTGLFNLSLRQGIRNLPFSAFTYVSENGAYQAPPDTSNEGFPNFILNACRGQRMDGTPQRDPVTDEVTRFAAAGNPLLHLGWTDGEHAAPGNRSLLVTMGPFELGVQDTQEVIIARIGAQGGPTVMEDLIALFDYAQCVSAHYISQFVTGVDSPPRHIVPAFSLAIGAPNPQPYSAVSHGPLQVPISLTSPESVTLRIVDLLGRTQYTEKSGMLPGGRMRVLLHIPSSLSPGVYLLTAEAGSVRAVRPVIIE